LGSTFGGAARTAVTRVPDSCSAGVLAMLLRLVVSLGAQLAPASAAETAPGLSGSVFGLRDRGARSRPACSHCGAVKLATCLPQSFAGGCAGVFSFGPGRCRLSINRTELRGDSRVLTDLCRDPLGSRSASAWVVCPWQSFDPRSPLGGAMHNERSLSLSSWAWCSSSAVPCRAQDQRAIRTMRSARKAIARGVAFLKEEQDRPWESGPMPPIPLTTWG